jgi:hypothetical protein
VTPVRRASCPFAAGRDSSTRLAGTGVVRPRCRWRLAIERRGYPSAGRRVLAG